MPVDRTPGGFGGKLREERERRGIALGQIASATKISVSVLDALERNDISRLPGGIFGRAFVRSYAVEVGLDPEETIREFMVQFPHDSVTAGHPMSEQHDDHHALESRRRMAATVIGLVLLGVVVAGVALYVGMIGRRARKVVIEPPTGTASETRSAAASSVPERPSVASSSGLGEGVEPGARAVVGDELPVAASATAAVGSAGEVASDLLVLELSVTRSCWLRLTVDGQRMIEGRLPAGEHRRVDVRRDLVLTVTDAAAVSVMLNGAEAKPLGKAGETVTKRVNLTNFKEYLLSR